MTDNLDNRPCQSCFRIECFSMRILIKLIGTILSILLTAVSGCAVHLTATRGGESVTVDLKPTTAPVETVVSSKGIEQ